MALESHGTFLGLSRKICQSSRFLNNSLQTSFFPFSGPVACAVDIDGYYDPNPAGGLGLELLATPLRWVDTRPPEPSFPAIYSGEGKKARPSWLLRDHILRFKEHFRMETMFALGRSAIRKERSLWRLLLPLGKLSDFLSFRSLPFLRFLLLLPCLPLPFSLSSLL